MPQFFVKISKISFWVLVPLLFFSNGTLNTPVDPIDLENGSYVFTTTGDFDKKLKGDINFESKIEIDSDGTPFSTLQFNLQNKATAHGHAFGFLVSKAGTNEGITKGTYKVAKNIDGFLNCFDGVFGFADIAGLGETPFFARNGKITISHFNDKVISGFITITLQNTNGKNITVKGNFTAVEK
ncbi:hypothetical protein [Costertonia aggregata]|uniref:Uncharacterized protein n=1 Tax=Costertonia aggregata TaxID=343403 RepID=A0A7H9ANW8_9FLAO|nr:hypothetical protein [Costertonia aggregata]QLG45149.1 hypothetical protein HYG79_07220 [Costertonia aggregata]